MDLRDINYNDWQTSLEDNGYTFDEAFNSNGEATLHGYDDSNSDDRLVAYVKNDSGKLSKMLFRDSGKGITWDDSGTVLEYGFHNDENEYVDLLE